MGSQLLLAGAGRVQLACLCATNLPHRAQVDALWVAALLDAIDTYLAVRCLLLADALEHVDGIPTAEAARVAHEAAAVLELLAEARAEGAEEVHAGGQRRR